MARLPVTSVLENCKIGHCGAGWHPVRRLVNAAARFYTAPKGRLTIGPQLNKLPHKVASAKFRRGQATIEYALIYAGVFLPLTFMIIFTAELLWVWHSVVDFTRQGAQYAATHCYQPGGSNVISYMQQNVPMMFDQDQFRDGTAEIEVSYYSRNAESGQLESFACDGSSCSRECVPDVVRVRINNYQFRAFFSYLGLPPVDLPNFSTSLPIESAGCNADEEGCLP